MADPSFYYAIFKKFQSMAGGNVNPGSGHVNDDDQSGELSGGFSLRQTQDMFGLYQHLSPHAPDFTVDDSVSPPTKLNSMMMPLNPNSTDPLLNPLFVMLKTSLTPGGVPLVGSYFFVKVNGQTWPVMPPPNYPDGKVSNADWAEFNASAPKLIDQFESWITAGKIDDAPKGAPLAFASLMQSLPPPFPGLSVQNNWPLLFVASMAGDDGRRFGDHSQPNPPANHVPANFWATSLIFLTDATGVTVHPQHLKSGEEYYVAAVVGNSGNTGAGTVASQPEIHVLCDALAFNTVLSPGVPLPSLGNLDVLSPDLVYKQYLLRSQGYDVVGFRFNVDAVLAGLKAALVANNIDLGGATPDAWLADSHPCVKVRITSGELSNPYKPSDNSALSLASDPLKDRHIAQRNLAPFEIVPGGSAKKSGWKNFILAQAGDGPNELAVQHALPADTFQILLALPKKTYDSFVAPTGTKAGGVLKTFAVLKTLPAGVTKPFPDAVILGQTGPDAGIQVAAHKTAPYLAAAIGIVWDPAKLKPLPWPPIVSKASPSAVGVSHATHDGTIVGGFTLQLYSKK